VRQIVIPRYGPPDVFELREAPDPVPRDGEVRVEVRAAGVNFADVMARIGLYPDAPKPPLVVGYEVSGIVDAIGRGVTRVREGDRVVALTRFGGYATNALAPESFVFPLRANVSDPEAAALPVNYLTALIALYRLANIVEGEAVLVLGAGGGVGIAATQLAKLRRATIIGTASPAKHAELRRLGVDHLLHRSADIAAEVRRITNGRGVDVVLDPIGGKSFATSYRLLAPLGRLVIYGVSTIAPGERRSWWHALKTMLQMPKFQPLSLMNKNRGVFGLNLAHLWDERQKLDEAMQLLIHELEAGRIRPIVAKTFPLDQAADAHRFLQARANIGKVVLTIES
jgi:NADPH:quinone reductase-like Zn-dependent oxidoreductase